MDRNPTEAFQSPPTVQEVVLAELRRELLSGDLRPGDLINQEHVAARLNVSAIPVREALRFFEGQGLVVYRARRQYMVPKLSVADLEEIFLLREQLESVAVTRGVPRLSEDDLKNLADRAAEFERLVKSRQRNNESISIAHREFMFCIFNASGLHILVRMLNNLWDMLEPYRALFVHRSLVTKAERVDLAAEKHAIVDAAERGDVPGVLDVIQRSAKRTLSQLTGTLTEDDGSDPA